MHTRIKEIREHCGLSQAEFGQKLGISRDAVSNLEYNRLKKPEQKGPIIKLICTEFGVNEVWLRTGTGEPFTPKTAEGELQSLMATLLSDGSSEVKALATVLARSTLDEWELYSKKLCELAKEVQKQKEKSDAD